MNINGMELVVLKPVLTEKFFKMVFVFVQLVNSSKKENALTIQSVKMEPPGTEKNVWAFHATQVLLTTVDAHAVKFQSSLVQLVPIGMVTDVFLSLTSVHLAWFGKTSNAEAIQQNVLETHMNSTELAFLFHPDAHQVWLGTTLTVAPQPATLAQLELITTERNVFHLWLVKMAESGMTLSVNASALKAHSQMDLHALDALPVNFMPTEDATVQTEPSSMELNALLEVLTDVFPFLTPTGTELTASASQDFQPAATHVSVTVL